MSRGSTAGTTQSIDDIDPIVDADTHFNETIDEVLPYLDDRFEAVRRHVEGAQLPLSEIFTLG